MEQVDLDDLCGADLTAVHLDRPERACLDEVGFDRESQVSQVRQAGVVVAAELVERQMSASAEQLAGCLGCGVEAKLFQPAERVHCNKGGQWPRRGNDCAAASYVGADL